MSPQAQHNAGAADGSVAGRSDLGGLTARVADVAPAVAGWVLPFLLVLYLALEDGGYGEITRGEVGIAIWWVLLIGAAIGVLPGARISRVGWIGLGLFAAFVVWTGAGIGWSESAERSVGELGRVATLLGVFTLALVSQRDGAARRMLGGVGMAIALVAALALLSRLEPNLFPYDRIADLLPGTGNRLSFPLGYWNGLAHLIAIGAPLLLWSAVSARLIALRAVSTAALPVMLLTAFLTLSRGGAVALVAALVVLFALHPRRLSLIPTLLLGAVGGGLLIAAATQRDAFVDGLATPSAFSQGDQMMAMTLIVCAGVGLLQTAFSLAERHGLGPGVPRPSPRRTAAAAGVVAAAAVVVVVALGAPAELSDRWDEFKASGGTAEGVERLESASGNGRYQLWQGALDANATAPLLGIGPGTFEFWWAREGQDVSFVRDAHSLYLEVLAELGIVGFTLIVGLVGFVLAAGALRAMKRPRGGTPILAAATAGATAFAVAAVADWDWELTVLPVAFLLLAAVILGTDSGSQAGGDPGRGPERSPAIRAGLVALAVVGLVAVAIPLAGSSTVEDSRAEVRAAALDRALSDARTAGDLQPYAGTPYLQEALILEIAGDLEGATDAAARATQKEPTNWRTWFVLSRVEAARGRSRQSISAYRRARSLNPNSALFSG